MIAQAHLKDCSILGIFFAARGCSRQSIFSSLYGALHFFDSILETDGVECKHFSRKCSGSHSALSTS
jgi:hypothetical protein